MTPESRGQLFAVHPHLSYAELVCYRISITSTQNGCETKSTVCASLCLGERKPGNAVRSHLPQQTKRGRPYHQRTLWNETKIPRIMYQPIKLKNRHHPHLPLYIYKAFLRLKIHQSHFCKEDSTRSQLTGNSTCLPTNQSRGQRSLDRPCPIFFREYRVYA